MNRTMLTAILVLGVVVCIGGLAGAVDMGAAFTYQGRLIDANEPADGLYDLQLRLYDSLAGGTQVGSTLDANEVDVNDGYFTLLLDFGSAAAVFDGNARWLEIGVREGALEDPNVYTVLVPRQELTPTPYALYAANAPGGAAADNDWKVTGTNMFSMPVGNVGIGTTTPVRKLDVTGDARFDGALYARDATGIGFRDDAGNLGLWVEVDGDVGIGTTAPDAELEVQRNDSATNSQIWVDQDGSGDATIGWSGGSQTYAIGIDNSDGDKFKISNSNSAGSNARITIDTSGNVGIGTTNPSGSLYPNSKTLEVEGIAPSIVLDDTDGTFKDDFEISNGGDKVLFRDATDNIDLLTIGLSGTIAGNVGVRTTSPQDRLDVDGDIRVRGADIKDSGGTSRIALIDNGNLYLREDGGSTRMTVATDGEIGIGTTTPDAVLDIEGTRWITATSDGIVNIGSSAGTHVTLDNNELHARNGSATSDLFLNDFGGDVYIGRQGKVYVGKVGDTSSLYVRGHLMVDYMSGTSAGSTVRWYNDRLYFYTSSKRYKQDIQPFQEDFHKILQAQPKSFTCKTTGEPGIGYIAEEFDELGLGSLVTYNNDGQPDALKYELVSLYLLEVVKDQQAKIAELEDALAQTQSLEQRLQAVENSIQEQRLTVVKEVQQ